MPPVSHETSYILFAKGEFRAPPAESTNRAKSNQVALQTELPSTKAILQYLSA